MLLLLLLGREKDDADGGEFSDFDGGVMVEGEGGVWGDPGGVQDGAV